MEKQQGLSGLNWLADLATALCLLVVVLASPCNAEQAQGTSNHQLFESQQYAEYLSKLDDELGKYTPEALDLSFDRISAVAMSLDRTKQWEGDSVRKVEAILAKSPDSLRHFRAVRDVIRGNADSITMFFEGKPPHYDAWRRATKYLQTHGYEVAANAFTALYMTGSTPLGTPQGPREVEAGVKALAALPSEFRTAVIDLISDRLDKTDNWYCRQGIAGTSVDLCRKSEPGVAESCLDIGVRFGASSAQLMQAAKGLLNVGKKGLAAKAACEAGKAAKPEDVQVLADAAAILGQCSDDAASASFYSRALAMLPKPKDREIRVQYMRWLDKKGKRQELIEHVRKHGEVGAADESALHGNSQQAAAAYAKQVRDESLPIEQRLDGWSGWLGVEPEQAIGEGDKLIAEAKSAGLLRWMGAQLWNATRPVARVSSHGVLPGPPRGATKVDVELPQSKLTKAAALMEQIIAADRVECLKVESGSESLRVPAAVLLAVSGSPEKALAVLNAAITYDLQPPPGGWRNPPGAPAPTDANQSRRHTSPATGEAGKWAREAISLVRQYGAQDDLVTRTERAFASILAGRSK